MRISQIPCLGFHTHRHYLYCLSSQPMMVPDSGQEDHKWSAKKMEADEGFKTVECLRKRLLAERQASRLAKLEEDSMGNKLIELERKLKEEVKLREKYERKLTFFKKKLESFNIASISRESEQFYSSERRENSRRSSTSSSTSRDPEENEIKSHITNPAASDDSTLNVSESPVIAKDTDSQVTDDSSSSSNPNPTSEDANKDESRVSEESSVTVTVADNEGDDGDFVDNSLAIVPVHLTSTKQAINPKPVNESVIEVLDALRDAREKLMGSMGTRQMVKVGP